MSGILHPTVAFWNRLDISNVIHCFHLLTSGDWVAVKSMKWNLMSKGSQKHQTHIDAAKSVHNRHTCTHLFLHQVTFAIAVKALDYIETRFNLSDLSDRCAVAALLHCFIPISHADFKNKKRRLRKLKLVDCPLTGQFSTLEIRYSSLRVRLLISRLNHQLFSQQATEWARTGTNGHQLHESGFVYNWHVNVLVLELHDAILQRVYILRQAFHLGVTRFLHRWDLCRGCLQQRTMQNVARTLMKLDPECEPERQNATQVKICIFFVQCLRYGWNSSKDVIFKKQRCKQRCKK